MLQYSKLHVAKAVDKTPYVQVYNTCIYPHEPAMGKYLQSTWIHYKCREVYLQNKRHCPYVNYLWPNIHRHVPFGVHIVYGHIWPYMAFSVCGHMYNTPKWFKSVFWMWHSTTVLPGSESHTEYWFVFLLHYIILGSTIHLVESLHVMITYHSTYYSYYPTAVSSLFPDPCNCLLFMCAPEGSNSMNVAFNFLFSVTHAWYRSVVSILLSSSVHVATMHVQRYLTPLYCIWEFPVTQIVRSYCRLYVVMWTVRLINYLWHVYHSQPL